MIQIQQNNSDEFPGKLNQLIIKLFLHFLTFIELSCFFRISEF